MLTGGSGRKKNNNVRSILIQTGARMRSVRKELIAEGVHDSPSNEQRLSSRLSTAT